MAPRLLQSVVASLGGVGKLNHVAIAVPSIADATVLYRDVLGASVSTPEVRGPAHRLSRGAHPRRRTSPSTESPSSLSTCPTPRSSSCSHSAKARRSPASSRKTPLVASTTSASRRVPWPTSPRALRRRTHPRAPRQVDDVTKAIGVLKKNGYRVLNDPPKIGAHGLPVTFMHPKDCNGVLVELEEVAH